MSAYHAAPLGIVQRISPGSIFDATSACRAALGPGIVVSADVFDVTSACYAARVSIHIVPFATSVGVGSVGRLVGVVVGAWGGGLVVMGGIGIYVNRPTSLR